MSYRKHLARPQCANSQLAQSIPPENVLKSNLAKFLFPVNYQSFAQSFLQYYAENGCDILMFCANIKKRLGSWMFCKKDMMGDTQFQAG